MLISEITIGDRFRKDHGDVRTLADSIRSVGLLHPVVVTPNRKLIAGHRRIEAARLLGWTEIPATVIDLSNLVRGEHDENAVRKDFTPSEYVAIAKVLEPEEREAARERLAVRSEKFPEVKAQVGNALDKVARAAGVSRPTLRKAQAVVEAAEAEPEKYAPLVEKMDRTGSVDGEPRPHPAAAGRIRIRKRPLRANFKLLGKSVNHCLTSAV